MIMEAMILTALGEVVVHPQNPEVWKVELFTL